jgi:hypothetical protein
MIGEYLFRVTAFLIFIWVLAAMVSFAISFAFPQLTDTSFIYSIICFAFSVVSLILFIFPQVMIHVRLKRYKASIIDLFNKKVEQIHDSFIKSFRYKDYLNEQEAAWTSRKDLYEEIEMIESYLNRMNSFGTWSYDFPEILKLIAVGFSTLLPIVLRLLFNFNTG